VVQSVVMTATIATIIVISIILAVYLIILKKSGWLGESSGFYRCPNPECKEIFQKPIELKDLSETPTRVYRACPECGVDLEQFFASRVRRNSKAVLSGMRRKVLSVSETIGFTSKPETGIMRKAPEKSLSTSKGSNEAKSKFGVEVSKDNQAKCPHFFGYLRTLPRGTPVPYACFFCDKMTDCYVERK
jgi:hypothetical protein